MTSDVLPCEYLQWMQSSRLPDSGDTAQAGLKKKLDCLSKQVHCSTRKNAALPVERSIQSGLQIVKVVNMRLL